MLLKGEKLCEPSLIKSILSLSPFHPNSRKALASTPWPGRCAEPQRASLATQAYGRAKEQHSLADCAYSLLTAAFCRLNACSCDETAEHLAEANDALQKANSQNAKLLAKLHE